MLLGNKKDWRTNTCYDMNEPQKHYTSHKRVHVVWLHLYEMPRTGKSVETEIKVVAT